MKRFFLLLFFLSMTIYSWSQEAKKPTLMILPSDHWCVERIYTQTFYSQGTKSIVPDYQIAFLQDDEIKGVTAKIGELLTKLNYSIKDCQQELSSITIKSVEENAVISKTGSTIEESSLDLLKKRTKSDIVILFDWEVNKVLQRRYLTFTLEAFDSYTSKRIATISGTTESSNDIVPVMLQKAIEKDINNFDNQITKFFDNQKVNGREILLNIKKWSSWNNDLETEYDGEELIDCIQKWLRENTVKGVFNLSDMTENFAQFEQVRIPLCDDSGNALDARSFVMRLKKYLQREPFNIPSKVVVRGLGEVTMILGEK